MIFNFPKSKSSQNKPKSIPKAIPKSVLLLSIEIIREGEYFIDKLIKER